MPISSTLQNFPELFIAFAGLIGLLIGSFLNVVIYRLPIMMERAWKKECREFLELDSEEQNLEVFNLILPFSRCPSCNTLIKGHQNIPIISYLFLKGQCANCKAHISIRYPLIEAFTGLSSAIVAWHFGYSPETLLHCCLLGR